MEKQRPIRTKRRIPEREQGFDVTYEINIGFVTFGEGEDSPVAAAMHLIGDHLWRNGEGGVYHFPGPNEDQVIRVEVSM